MKNSLQTLRDLLSLFRNHPWAIPAIVTLCMLSSLAEGFGISLFMPFLQGLNQPVFHSDSGGWFEKGLAGIFSQIPQDHRLAVIAGCIFGAILLKAFLSFGASALFGWLDMRITHHLRSSIFRQILNVEYGFIEQSPSGKLFNILSTETWRTSDALSTLVGLIISLCMITVYATLLLLISWKLTLLVLAFMTIVSMVIRTLTRHVKSLGRNLTQANALFSKRMVQAIDGMKMVRAFCRESYEQERFDKVSGRISRLVMKLTITAGFVNPLYEILAGGLLVYVIFTTLQSPSGLPPLMVFIFVLYRLQPKIKELDEQRVKLGALSASVTEVMSLLATTGGLYSRSGSTPFKELRKGVRLEHVWFTYGNSRRPALHDVSVFFASGKTTALVGPSGGGKSTLVKLMLRLFDPSKGRIFADDHPLDELDLFLWRTHVALVSQDIYLFDASVRDNIAYGRLDAETEEVMEAARQADAHEFISQLPNGYDTEVGDRGVRLSGGQQQRISMARAFLRNPEILILDEPTSVLDTISERMIQDALTNLRQDCTVIVIAHRLSTIKQADHIIVLDEGYVREEGDLNHLLAHGGLFAKLYNLQFPSKTT